MKAVGFLALGYGLGLVADDSTGAFGVKTGTDTWKYIAWASYLAVALAVFHGMKKGGA